MPSIHRKIKFGFYALAGTLAVVAVFALVDLRYLEGGIELEVTVSDFVDAVLELRRYEKNYLLYGARDDFGEVATYRDKAISVFDQQRGTLARLTDAGELDRLRRALDEHARLFSELEALGPRDFGPRRVTLARKIREAGRVLSEGAEAIASAQRTRLLAAVGSSQLWLPVAIAVVGLAGLQIAQRASRAAIQPLARLQNELEEIGHGSHDRLDPPSNDREIVAVTDAVNRMLEEIETRRRHLMQSEKLASLGTLVAGVAHELNNPLSNISSTCQILLEELSPEESKRLRDWLQQIDDETERARHIVRTLLEFSRERAFARREVRLREVIDKSLLLLGKAVRLRGHLRVEVPDDLLITADEQRLQQVCVNLIGNALDAGGPEVHIRIHAELAAPHGVELPEGVVFAQAQPASFWEQPLVLLTVADDGPGIAEDMLRRVFDPFFTTKDVGRGSGLGLFIAQEIIHQHDGSIAVHSRPNQGTAFYICLPHERAEVA